MQRGNHDAPTMAKLVVWLQNNKDTLNTKTSLEAKQMFDTEYKTNVAKTSLIQCAKELNISFRNNKSSKGHKSDRVRRLAMAVRLLIRDIESKIGMEEGTLGNNGCTEILNKIIGGK